MYLRQLWNRDCRSSVSATAEATNILLTYPDEDVGSCRQNTRGRRPEVRSAKHLGDRVRQALFVFLRRRNGQTDFDVLDRVPANDPQWGVPKNGTFVLLNANRDDPGF